MTLHSSSQLALTRDIVVCLTEESHGDEAADALAYALSLAGMAGAHLTVQSAARRLTVVAGRAWGTSRILLRMRTGAFTASRRRSPNAPCRTQPAPA